MENRYKFQEKFSFSDRKIPIAKESSQIQIEIFTNINILPYQSDEESVL